MKTREKNNKKIGKKCITITRGSREFFQTRELEGGQTREVGGTLKH